MKPRERFARKHIHMWALIGWVFATSDRVRECTDCRHRESTSEDLPKLPMSAQAFADVRWLPLDGRAKITRDVR